MNRVLARVCAFLFYAAIAAHADEFPSKPVKLVVPVAAGGSADLLGRLIGQKLSDRWKQPVVVENRPGAGGHIGAQYVAKQPADGYTLLVGLQQIQAVYSMYPKLMYDPRKELDTLSVIGNFPSVLIVHPSVNASNVQDFIRLSKQAPDGLTFGSAGIGSGTHMGGELFMAETGAKLSHIPYRGSSAASADLMGGQIQAMFENLPTAIGLIKGGRVKALGITGRERYAGLPDLPTVSEQGIPKYEFQGWYTIAVPHGMPAELRKKISADLDLIVHSDGAKAKWDELGVTPIGGTPDDSNAFVRKEADKYSRLVKAANLKAEN